MESIGSNFKKQRQKNKLTQEITAEKLNVTKSYISKVENNNKKPNMEFLVRAAELFNCDVADFYNEDVKVELDEEGFRWAIFGQKMKQRGIDMDQLDDLVKIIQTLEKEKNNRDK
ncbi:helix-turn-helix domain-containing protein [Metabacillus sp. GX 13764]|uniref:helix-turn-helix domain-containing protein n=1 Tax=Metabacillus kandeliae TaxID=2900151 RepID=UPI001E48FBA3|nr:helix-turn-helix transcriptional regulator [Metabacillus kandeliae]MCD7034345.1 helix-turn-helix domain-containing protein [Metabacillus kandeliae]